MPNALFFFSYSAIPTLCFFPYQLLYSSLPLLIIGILLALLPVYPAFFSLRHLECLTLMSMHLFTLFEFSFFSILPAPEIPICLTSSTNRSSPYISSCFSCIHSTLPKILVLPLSIADSLPFTFLLNFSSQLNFPFLCPMFYFNFTALFRLVLSIFPFFSHDISWFHPVYTQYPSQASILSFPLSSTLYVPKYPSVFYLP